MFEGFRLFPARASAYALEVDRLYFFLLGLAAFFVGLITCALLFFSIRYRHSLKRRGDYEHATLADSSVMDLIKSGLSAKAGAE